MQACVCCRRPAAMDGAPRIARLARAGGTATRSPVACTLMRRLRRRKLRMLHQAHGLRGSVAQGMIARCGMGAWHEPDRTAGLHYQVQRDVAAGQILDLHSYILALLHQHAPCCRTWAAPFRPHSTQPSLDRCATDDGVSRGEPIRILNQAPDGVTTRGPGPISRPPPAVPRCPRNGPAPACRPLPHRASAARDPMPPCARPTGPRGWITA